MTALINPDKFKNTTRQLARSAESYKQRRAKLWCPDCQVLRHVAGQGQSSGLIVLATCRHVRPQAFRLVEEIELHEEFKRSLEQAMGQEEIDGKHEFDTR